MHYRELGRTGLKVSRIGLGTMTWGEQNTEAEAHAQLDLAFERGVNFIDTAEMYPVPPRAETQGLTEQYIGSWLTRRGCRDKVILATKATGPSNMKYLRGGTKLNRKQLLQAVEDSLQRLNTDYIDLYQLHWPERQANYFGQLGYTVHTPEHDGVPLEESLETLEHLTAQGKIRHAGLSNETAWGVHHCLDLAGDDRPRIVSIQNPYNLLNRTFEVGLAEMACREQVGLLAYSPLGFGVLSGKYLDGARPQGARLTLFERFKRYLNDQAQEATARYVQLAREHDLDPAQMALAFVNSRPFLTSNLIGATSLEQLEANIASDDIDLDTSLIAAIDDIHAGCPNPAP